MDIFMQPLFLNAEDIEREIKSRLIAANAPTEASVFVELRVDCTGATDIVICDVSPYEGYERRCVDLTGVPVVVNSPFGLHCTSARREALEFANDIASAIGCDVAIECNDAQITSIDGGAVFGVIGHEIIASTALKNVGSVEREWILRIAKDCDLKVEEREILRADLPKFEELFYCNHWGITALSRCEKRRYAKIIATKIAEFLMQPW